MGKKYSKEKINPNFTGPSPGKIRLNRILKKRKEKKKASESSDLKLLSIRCGLREEIIRDLYIKVFEKNPEGKLSKNEFIELYCSLRTESFDKLVKISEFIFKSFDRDNNGTIDWEEFIVSRQLLF